MQTEHNLLTTDEATRLILKSRHNVYEFGDKANKLLALQARQTAAAWSSTEIQNQPADLIHMFWVCPSLFNFWRCIFKSFSEMFKTCVEPDPVCALFGLAPKVTCASLPNSAHVVIAFSTLLARRLILLKWKQHSPPSFSQWVKDVMYFLQLEKMSSYSGAPLTPLLEHGNPFWTSMTPYKIHLIKNKVGLSGEQ
ncbi:hypothetical protein F7725_007801 [Dissostichus mawsoni]|uniref:Reverse transcriptase n=1 Tax=Dissostichus mawsoni TaxID=36200 RepID=A0A7J5Y8F0_DISMA|nr:hypothetical protein F7725_007801 [Dissostichus mawsoni]